MPVLISHFRGVYRELVSGAIDSIERDALTVSTLLSTSFQLRERRYAKLPELSRW